VNLVDSIKKHEGLSLTVYQCTTGANTIGYGRNLDTNGITKQEAELLLMNDIKNATKQAKTLDFYQGLTAARQEVIIELVYNLGLKGFKTFTRAIKAIERADYEVAGNELLDSKWCRQVGLRALTLSNTMKNG